MRLSNLVSSILLAAVLQLLPLAGTLPAQTIGEDLGFMGGLGDRSLGSAGAEQAADFILKRFTEVGLTSVGVQQFLHPVPEVTAASIHAAGFSAPIYPWGPNMVYLPVTPEEGLSGPLVYVGDGNLTGFQGYRVEGAVVLMDSASGDNWMNAAMLGAHAIIYLGDREATRDDYRQKNIPTPVAFPRFWVPPETAERLKRLVAQEGASATVSAQTRWQNKLVRNCYGLLPGKSKNLKEELMVVEAFYDASSPVLGLAPGADEATSIAVLLALAKHLSQNPPERSVLFVATTGNGQGQAGMREFIYAATGRKKAMKDQEKILDGRKKQVEHLLELLKEPQPLDATNPADRDQVWKLVVSRAKDTADRLAREIQIERVLRGTERPGPKTEDLGPKPQDSGPKTQEAGSGLQAPSSQPQAAGSTSQAAKAEGKGGGPVEGTEPAVEGSEEGAANESAADPRVYRRLAWGTGDQPLTGDDRALAEGLLKGARKDLKAERDELKQRLQANRSSQEVRRILGDFTPTLLISLHLSSHSPLMGLSEIGGTYPLREEVRRHLRAFRLNEALVQISGEVSRETGLPDLWYPEIGRTGGGAAGKSPAISCYCCDVAALADLPAVSFTTLEDSQVMWSTPGDTVDRVDTANLKVLERSLPLFFSRLGSLPKLGQVCEAGIRGFASISGQAMFLRQGELFPDQPAPGTIICAIQGESVFRTMVYRDGTFHLPGVANKRVAFEKVLLESYGIDPRTGRVAWTADKKQTDKENYRVKIKGELASISLTMFRCEQTDVLHIFDPRKMDHLTRVQLLDAARGAVPLRYWYSRVDGRDTTAISLFLEKGTRFKLIMSDGLLHKQLLLLNASPEWPTGRGFLIGAPGSIPAVPFQVARDMHQLLQERVANLHQRGIVNRYLEDLYADTTQDLGDAATAIQDAAFGPFWERVIAAWAKLDVIYNEVENTQRDVLAGVLFFIALFVPFAYCMERYLFCFRGVYQQIAAFLLILLMTIFTIKALHPAFELTYSPMVVIIAFFIVGLSVMVGWIIFVRFEQEMADLQRHAAHLSAPQVSKWQAFGAGFAIGVSNLNRRKLRTALTCTTLVILTFTVMSFTNVKTFHKTTHTRIADSASYQGILVRHQYRKALLPVFLEDLETRFRGKAEVWPRAWIPAPGGTDRTLARVRGAGPEAWAVEGILGMGANAPEYYRKLLVQGRWFQPGERNVVLLPSSAARRLGFQPEAGAEPIITFWGVPFKVIGYLDDNLLETSKELDNEPLTPAFLEGGQGQELTEAEVEAIQSGEEVLPIAEKFRYARAGATVILPYETCMSYGGELKSITILPGAGEAPLDLADQLATWLAFPLYVGQDATYFHSASSTLRYQGVANLLIPILIVIFICLNTLIGHVHERRKEISIYTSVGLAPTHVGFLFIVEALSLAVISTVIGYILAQLTAKYLGQTALFSQLTFNYSSLASVACMVLVFSVVFLSALYPARLAAEMAMPDVNRSWTLPSAAGDRITMNLPFLLKYEEEQGIMGFMTNFFLSYQDAAHGAFIVDNTSMQPEGLEAMYDGEAARRAARRGAREGEKHGAVCLLLRANIWLAPFDFGIKQDLRVHCCPSEDNPGYLELALQMNRMSGEVAAWFRANKNFIQALRKQMLLWRLLDKEAKDYYAYSYAVGGGTERSA
jgi:hypothetical protein